MFTGIIELVGTITDTRTVPGGRSLGVRVGPIAAECPPGASLCVSGVCLTVSRVTAPVLTFDVITETLEKSVLSSKRTGDLVNVERACRAGDRLDGHFVQGHVDGTACVERVQASSREHVVWLRPDSSLVAYIIPKGSVAVDGVSLTIADVADACFSVALIPTTLTKTTLSSLSAGDRVNIESDIIARTVVHSLAQLRGKSGVTISSLQQAGFV